MIACPSASLRAHTGGHGRALDGVCSPHCVSAVAAFLTQVNEHFCRGVESRVQCPAMGLVSEMVLWAGLQNPGSQSVWRDHSRVPQCQACLPTLFTGGPQPQLALGGGREAFFSFPP